MVAALLSQAARSLQAGRPGEAIAPLERAALVQPRNAAILHDLGLACLESGRIGDSIVVLQRAVAADPAFADSHLRLGIALEKARALEAALAAYARAVELEPSLADAHYRTGHLLDGLGQAAAAIQAFRRAAAAAPQTTLGHIAAARASLAQHQDGDAERSLRRALVLEPGNAVALELLGQSFADRGRFAEAGRCLARAIERAPALAGSYYDLVRCRPLGAADRELIERMRRALALPGLEPSQRSRVHLALGKAADDLGDYREAMRQCDAAAALRSAVVRFDLAEFEARVERLIQRCTPQLMARAPSSGRNDDTAILIFGLPRSGTTLVEQILSAHPQVRGAGELPFWNERGVTWDRSGAAEPDPAQLESAVADYRRLLDDIAPDGARVTDKMPLNFQWAGLVHLALPRAMLVHCRRAPLDTALSIHQTHFNSHMPFPTGGAALVGYMRAYRRLMEHWLRIIPAGQLLQIEYETLVANPEPEIRRIVAACGLEWHEACLHPERNMRAVRTPSKWQARRPIYPTAVGRWRAYQPWLGPLRALLD